jgi:hypothetical protein
MRMPNAVSVSSNDVGARFLYDERDLGCRSYKRENGRDIGGWGADVKRDFGTDGDVGGWGATEG